MDDATVAVTGATSGLGRAVADAFADAGARVVVCGRDAEAVEAAVELLPGEASGLRADVRDEYDLERFVESAARAGSGAVDVLVPAAAVRHGDPGETSLAATSYAAFDDTMRTNARGVFAVIREALAHMPADGRVLVPTCHVARDPGPDAGAYAVSKATAEALARGFAADSEPAVGAVDPGPLDTGLSDGDGRDPEAVAGLFLWAARDVAPDELDGGVLSADDWEAAAE